MAWVVYTGEAPLIACVVSNGKNSPASPGRRAYVQATSNGGRLTTNVMEAARHHFKSHAEELAKMWNHNDWKERYKVVGIGCVIYADLPTAEGVIVRHYYTSVYDYEAGAWQGFMVQDLDRAYGFNTVEEAEALTSAWNAKHRGRYGVKPLAEMS